MKRTRFTLKSMLLASMIVFLAGTFFLSSMALADDEANTIDSATLTIVDNAFILSLPELAVEGTDLLYSAKLQLKQEGENFFLELIELGPCQYQQASEIAATLSTDGTLHIPLFMYAQAENATFWTIDLKLADNVSLLPIQFNINNIVQVPKFDHGNDDLLGQTKKTTITIKTPFGPIVIVIEQDDGKPKPFVN